MLPYSLEHPVRTLAASHPMVCFNREILNSREYWQMDGFVFYVILSFFQSQEAQFQHCCQLSWFLDVVGLLWPFALREEETRVVRTSYWVVGCDGKRRTLWVAYSTSVSTHSSGEPFTTSPICFPVWPQEQCAALDNSEVMLSLKGYTFTVYAQQDGNLFHTTEINCKHCANFLPLLSNIFTQLLCGE